MRHSIETLSQMERSQSVAGVVLKLIVSATPEGEFQASETPVTLRRAATAAAEHAAAPGTAGAHASRRARVAAETPRLSAWVRLAPGVPGAACCSALAMASVHSAFGFGVMP